jgi:hypothetical protein
MKKSPFPGMDPFLERHWEDVHPRLISYVADAIQPQLADDLIARMEERVFVEDDKETRLRKPDVRVVEFPSSPFPAGGGGATALAEADVTTDDQPLLLQPLDDPIRERSVLISDVDGNRIVTAIEVLSPWNKTPGSAARAYLEKRKKYVHSDANLVEIDLVRAGDWTTMIGPYEIPERARTTYRVTVVQPDQPGPFLYPISMRARLPRIKVPLRPQDAPATLDLRALVDKAYEMGRYDRIDYARPCTPPAEGAEAQWFAEVLRAAGRT